MKINILNQLLAYDVSGSGDNIILLHGWGANRFTWNKVYNHLIEKFRVYAIDLPGFGESEEPKYGCSIDELALLLFEFIAKLNIYNPIIIGHSYGGRIAIKYASKYNISKLVLIDSAGLKQKLSFRKSISQKTYKLLKKAKIKINLGSSDYKNASLVMKNMLVKAVNEDQTSDLVKINCPTLLIWGSDDEITKVSDAKKMNKLIKNSGLVIIKDCSHFPYLDDFSYFILVLDSYVRRQLYD